MKHKKYAAGGPTDYSESGSGGGSSISFGEAFKAARKQGLDTFTWRGKKYTTEVKEDKKPKDATVNFAKEGKAPTVDFAKEGRVSPKPKTIAAGVEPDDTPSQAMRDEARYKARNQKAPGRPGRERPMTMQDAYAAMRRNPAEQGYKRGGSVKSSASRRADGIAKKGKTRGRFI